MFSQEGDGSLTFDDFLNMMSVFSDTVRLYVFPHALEGRIWVLTLSSPGFFGSSQPGRGHFVPPPPPPHHNFFVIGRIMMKLGKLVKCLKLYLMIGFWWVNWL